MTYTTFANQLCDYLNENLTGLKVIDRKNGFIDFKSEDSKPTLSINAHNSYESLVSEDMCRAEFKNILDSVCEARKFAEAVDPSDYSSVKGRLIPRIIAVKGNEQTLSYIPHTIIDDMAVIYTVLIADNGDIIAYSVVSNEHAHLCGVDSETLHEDAMRNYADKYPAIIDNYMVMALKLQTDPTYKSSNRVLNLGHGSLSSSETFNIVQSTFPTNGAAALFQPGILDKLADAFDSDVLILPSSIHEFIILKLNPDANIDAFQEMVKFINETEVEPHDRLTDSVYGYFRDTKTFKKLSHND